MQALQLQAASPRASVTVLRQGAGIDGRCHLPGRAGENVIRVVTVEVIYSFDYQFFDIFYADSDLRQTKCGTFELLQILLRIGRQVNPISIKNRFSIFFCILLRR